MARGRPAADGPWSSACGWPRVVCGRFRVVCGWPGSIKDRLHADGPGSSACGWPRVVCLRMAPGSSADGSGPSADGSWSSADGRLPNRVICLRMARGRLRADGPVVVCGWPVVVYGWPASKQGHLLADGTWSSACGWPSGRLRMARWSSTDGRVPTRDVCLRMAQRHLLADGPGLSKVVCGWRSRLSNRLPRGSRHPVGSSL